MADPLVCLRNATLAIAFWNILYAIIQMAVMGWQCKVVKDLQWEFENREIPYYGEGNPFQARFPGLYQLYTETPERRRVNAMYVIVLINIVLAIIHVPFSVCLFYGAFKYRANFVWPWIPSAVMIIAMSTTYAVLWWSGDVFNVQLTMSVAEFVMSLGINGICVVVVAFFFFRLNGHLHSNKPSTRPGFRGLPPQPYGPVAIQKYPHGPITVQTTSTPVIPPWREEWPELPDAQLRQKLRRQGRRRGEDLDFFAPEPYDREFPWNMKKISERPPPRASAQETIERMYYDSYPEEQPGLPRGMRESLKKERKASTVQRKTVI